MGEGALTADDGIFEALTKFDEDDAKRVAEYERQDFIDRAAIAMLAARTEDNGGPVGAGMAYDYAEALWAERERRRNA